MTNNGFTGNWRTVWTSEADHIVDIRFGTHSLGPGRTIWGRTVGAKDAGHIVAIRIHVHLGTVAELPGTVGIEDLWIAADLAVTIELHVWLGFGGPWRTTWLMGMVQGIPILDSVRNGVGLKRSHEGKGSEEEGGRSDELHVDVGIRRCLAGDKRSLKIRKVKVRLKILCKMRDE
jgi:hypothetical protein